MFPWDLALFTIYSLGIVFLFCMQKGESNVLILSISNKSIEHISF